MAKKKTRILIVGTGTIGEPLIHILTKEQKGLDVGEVLFHKRTPLIEEVGKVKDMIKAGALLVVDKDKKEQFRELGLEPAYIWEESEVAADVTIDCTPEGNKLKEKYYLPLSQKYPNKGFIAQGSENGFGIPYIWAFNDSALDGRWIQTVSCNTHQFIVPFGSLVVPYEGIENVEYAFFAIERRASDISQDESIGGVIAENSDYGDYDSHQAYDAARVLKTLYPAKILPKMIAKVTKGPTQYMHTAKFFLVLKSPITIDEVKQRFRANPLVARTMFKSSNKVFARARDSSKSILGRILNQTVICERTLNVSYGHIISATCFTPQDGNALLSSVAATLWLLDPKTYKEKMKVFDKYLFEEV